MSAEARF